MRKEKAGVTIYYCGHEACEPGHFFGPAVRAHFLLHFVIKGKGRYRVGNTTFELQENVAFLIRPEEITYYEADENDPWEYIWMAFDGPWAESILEEYGLLKDAYICHFEKESSNIPYLKALVEAFVKGGDSQYELLGYFYLLFSGMQKAVTQQGSSGDKDYFKKAEEYMRHNYSYPIHISDIAKHVGIERTYLYKIFMKYKKKSPKQYLTVFRLMAAKDMLGNTSLSITEIALSCGFHDSSSFCKSFQKSFQYTPLSYRRYINGRRDHQKNKSSEGEFDRNNEFN